MIRLANSAEVLAFWFGACPLDEAAMARVQGQWFKKDRAFDQIIRDRFAPTIAAALQGDLDDWTDSPQGALARIVVLDQFTRNAFRGKPESFSGDAKALSLALDALDKNADQAVLPMARTFFYMPLEHAEDMMMQNRAVQLFERLAAQQAEKDHRFFATSLDYARQHREVIKRFGRFAHRNAILGRTSTAEEQAYLEQPGAGF